MDQDGACRDKVVGEAPSLWRSIDEWLIGTCWYPVDNSGMVGRSPEQQDPVLGKYVLVDTLEERQFHKQDSNNRKGKRNRLTSLRTGYKFLVGTS